MTCASTYVGKEYIEAFGYFFLSETGILFMRNSLGKDDLLLSFPIAYFNIDHHFILSCLCSTSICLQYEAFIFRLNVLKVLLKDLYFCIFSQIGLFSFLANNLTFVRDDVKSPLVNQGSRFKNLEEFDSWRGKDLLNIAEYIFMNSSYAVLGHSMLLMNWKFCASRFSLNTWMFA